MKPSHRTVLELAALALIIVAVFVAGTALAANAAEPGCTTITIDHTDDGPVEGPIDWNGGPYTAVVGDFVWFDFSDEPSAGWENTLSFDVSSNDIVSATACSDGSVAIERDVVDAPPSSDSDIGSALTVERLSPLCEIHPDTLARYCTLPNLTLVIS